MHIVLIGMPGAGKSTVGRRLAEVLGYQFCDPDKVMEASYGMPLQKVLEAFGAEGFLKAEAETVIACAAAKGPCVIAPGGSVVYSDEAMRALQATSLIVHLEAPLSTIEARIGKVPRGIVGNMTLGDLYKERAPLYRAWAMRTVRADWEIEEIVNDILVFTEASPRQLSDSPRPGQSL